MMQVYFIRCAGRIKIGTTKRWQTRLRNFSTSLPEPPEVLALIPGGKETEKYLHEKFSDLRQDGEWFAASDALESYVKRLASGEETLPDLGGVVEIPTAVTFGDDDEYLADAREHLRALICQDRDRNGGTLIESLARIAARVGVPVGMLHRLKKGCSIDGLRLRGLTQTLKDERIADIDVQIAHLRNELEKMAAMGADVGRARTIIEGVEADVAAWPKRMSFAEAKEALGGAVK